MIDQNQLQALIQMMAQQGGPVGPGAPTQTPAPFRAQNMMQQRMNPMADPLMQAAMRMQQQRQRRAMEQRRLGPPVTETPRTGGMVNRAAFGGDEGNPAIMERVRTTFNRS